MTALMALALSWVAFGNSVTLLGLEWFIGLLINVCARYPKAAGCREVLDNVPQLRPLGAALDEIWLYLSARRGAGRCSHVIGRVDLDCTASRDCDWQYRCDISHQGSLLGQARVEMRVHRGRHQPKCRWASYH
jgi:hypothetical protein